jgi:NADPH:quinone reductase-like Zn-dependent oxidoreductase
LSTPHAAPAPLPGATMRAAQFHRYGGPEVITTGIVPVPVPRAGEVLIRVGAVSLNGGEVLFRSGKLRLLSGRRFPKGLGVDYAGEIVAIGDGVADVAVGDQVWGFINNLKFAASGAPAGSAAEYVAVESKRVAPMPVGKSPSEAVALLVGTAALTALRDKAALQPGERLLVRGGTGGVGYVGVQLGHAFGAHVTTLVSTPKMDLARSLGADIVLDYRTTRPEDLGEFDVILDTAGSNMSAYRKHLSRGGRMVTINFSPLWAGALTTLVSVIHGRRRIRFFEGRPIRADLVDYASIIESASIRALIGGTHDLEDMAGAQRALEAGGSHGKRVIRLHDQA